MPKNKVHSGASKRFKLTGSGKLRREAANRRHYAEWKPSKRMRRIDGTFDVAPADTKRIKRMLGL